MKFLLNDLIDYNAPKVRTIRILWLQQTMQVAAVIDIHAHDAKPELIQVDAIESDLESGTARLLTDDPHLALIEKKQLTSKALEVRSNAWKLISDMAAQVPEIFYPKHRAEKVMELVLQGLATRRTIYRHLRRFWQRGQTPNALLPDYVNCGGKGKTRASDPQIKRGRPRRLGTLPGLNVDAEIRKTFCTAVDRFYLTKAKFNLKSAYDQMIKEFFVEKTIDSETGRVTHAIPGKLSSWGFPTFRQFEYWYNKDHNKLEVKRKRVKPRVYDKDMRGLIGTSNAEVWGPGARYQIDATIADVFLVSRSDRTKIIGRPVLYIVIDVFSRMIVGIYVGLEGPSWVGAMMALANTASDKKEFCKNNGIEIELEDWPCRNLPAAILGDRGEIEGAMIETLINTFNVAVESAAAYRADWKGIVEQRFRLIPSKFKPFVPGYIDVDYRARGGTDYRLDAVLDLTQFTQIIIQCVLYYNNSYEIKRYDKDADLAAQEFAAVPIDLWSWGIQNRSGSLRQYPEELVRFSLLPVFDASITLHGIRLKGLFYTCKKAMEERWFDAARQKGVQNVKVSMDPRNLDEIYLHDQTAPLKFYVCHLTERSRAFRQRSIWEIGQLQEQEKQTSAKRETRQQLSIADLSANIESIVSAAVTQTGNRGNNKSDAARTKNIRKNRATEKQLNRSSEAFRFQDKSAKSSTDASLARPLTKPLIKSIPSKSADILSFPTGSSEDYSEPDITEIMHKDDGDDNKS